MPQKKYDHRSIEKKWQGIWEKEKPWKASLNPTKPKYYVLDMFPYPSGAGLHVGHVTGYTATDIVARLYRMRGYEVLHPMGWDSFGLPAEQYAIRTGTHPRETTKQNIETYRRQLKSLGLSYDWDREFATSDASYYKWTQWIFTKLYEKGLAYEADILVNYCPKLQTVLSNEEVENGFSKEGGHPIERRPLRQWVLKITAYADRLLEDLDLLDWPEGLKKLQKNWIGRSEGAEIFFETEKNGTIETFTTRPDTLMGVTYLVLAPEHPLVNALITEEQRASVEKYIQETARKSDLARTDLNEDKSGVFLGSFAVHPVTGEKIPLWIGDYVLAHYGTGAVMAVPNHDERDFFFAKKYNLPMKRVIMPLEEVLGEDYCFTEEGILVSSSWGELILDGMPSLEAKEKIIYWLEEKNRGRRKISYKLRDWLFSRQRYWGEPFPVLHLEDGSTRILQEDELPLIPPEIEDYKPTGDMQSPLAREQQWIELIDPITGMQAKRDTNTMPQWAGSCWYYLRFCDPQNVKQAFGSDAEKYFMPVDLYIGGAEHAVLHLLYARFWHKVLYDLKLVSTKEPFQKLFNQGLVVAYAYKKPGGGYVAVENVEKRGESYFEVSTGDEVIQQIEKMSKSKLNGVSPDEMIEDFGADTLRLYEMFMGPLDKEKIWNRDAVQGCRRFLNRFFDLVHSDKVKENNSPESLILAHKLLDGVEKDYAGLQFNTVIAKMMECLNELLKLKYVEKEALILFVKVLFPIAPHIAQELFIDLGGKGLLDSTSWPEKDPSLLKENKTLYIIQVSGKMRGKLEVDTDMEESLVISEAKKDANVQKHLEGKTITQTIFVKNRLINFVCS